MTQTPNVSSSFRHIRSTKVDSLNIEIQHYEHIQTGAVHYHLNADYDEKVFMVAVRTMPHDSTGVAHILEHTALCGSEKYQVRDPFFMMTRRSLNTFMNAMTSSDWTAYPFASQNDKDFNNLLDVYLDAVFFARLHELDFAQEGHRVELEDSENLESPLVYKGVVFNEMKGAMSSPISQLWQGISGALFPTTTYHYNSGGEPENILDLSYQELLDFYRSHYHPSNAIFMTFGDLNVAELQDKLNDQALSRFERQQKQWRVEPEQRFQEPVQVVAKYGLDDEDLSAKTHHVVGWLLGDSVDLDAQLEAHLVSQVLLDNSASPLRKALEQSDLGQTASPLCGLEDSNREMSFICGVDGSEPEHAEAVEAMILECLKDVANNGVAQDLIDAAIHQLELHQREIGGDSYPYGLQLILNSLAAATHYGDPTDLLNLDPALERLRARAAQPDFMQEAVTRLLLNNPHRVRYSLVPDAKLNGMKAEAEKTRLAKLKATLSHDDLVALQTKTKTLEERQAAEDDPGLLPCVTLSDVRPQMAYMAPTRTHTEGMHTSEYVVGTNGIVYQQQFLNLPALSAEHLTWLPFFTQAWTEVGAGGHDYLTQQQRQTAVLGSLSAYASVRGDVNDANRQSSYLVMTGKALATKVSEFSDIIKETWQNADFSENKRLLDLLSQAKSRREQGMSGGGHSLAMSVAAAPLNLSANFMDQLSGMPQAVRLKERYKQAKESNGESLVVAMQDVYAQIAKAPDSSLLVHDDMAAIAHNEALNKAWPKGSAASTGTIAWQAQDVASFWMIDTQVNFCAWALPTVTITHADAAPLAVLSGILRNAFLHTAIREKGGAYGAGASQDSSMACFKFYSYRDPRVEGTLDDFRASIDWVLKKSQGDDLVEQSILGIIGSLDRPGSPAGEAKNAFHMDKSGRSLMIRQAFREGVLHSTWKDVQRVAETYLKNQEGSRAVLAPRGSQALADKLGMKSAQY